MLSLNLTPLQFMILSQAIIFILGWPLEWTEIIIIFVPIFLPMLQHFGIDPILCGVLVFINLQAAFLSPPVAMSAYYLKGVAPSHVTLNQIFPGMMPYMLIVILCMVLLYLWPGLALWLPRFATAAAERVRCVRQVPSNEEGATITRRALRHFTVLDDDGLRRAGRHAERLLEEGERAAPGEVGGGLVVARGAEVVVEGVLRARIDVDRVFLVVGLQRRLVGRDAGVHALVLLGVVQQQRRLDLRHLVGRHLPP